MITCFKCLKSFEEEDAGELLENDDARIWYCEECMKPIRAKEPIKINLNPNNCQWCKEPMDFYSVIPWNVISMHLDCYDKILSQITKEE
jgi:hypothetical protein